MKAAGLWAFTALLFASLDFIELHGPDGQIVFLNINEISSMRQPTKSDLTHYFPKRVKCIVVTTNGKFYATAETCGAIRDKATEEGK